MALAHREVTDASGEALSARAALALVGAQLDAMYELLQSGNLVAATVAASEARSIIAQLLGPVGAGEVGFHTRAAAYDVSPAELRVLCLLDSYRTLPQIAAELLVSRNTVKSHVRALYAKLNVSSRAEAVTEARRRGLLPLLSDRLDPGTA